MPRQFPYWDLKYFYQVHCRKQQLQWLTPVGYNQFIKRVKKMSLHDAIHYPRNDGQVRNTTVKPTVEDYQRRVHILNEENVQIVDLDKLEQIEKPVIYPRKANKIQIPKPKQNLFLRFISFFKN